MGTAETASCLDLTEEAVKVRLFRARQILRNELYIRAGATSSQAFQFMGTRCDRVLSNVMIQIASHNERTLQLQRGNDIAVEK